MPIKSQFPDVPAFEIANFADFILNYDQASQNPSITAIVDDSGRSQTFGQFRKEVEAVACGLHNLGVRKGDIVAICLPHCIEYMNIVMGIVSRGAICCGLDPHFTSADYEYHLSKYGPRWIFVSSKAIKSVVGAIKNLGGTQTEKLIAVGNLEDIECLNGISLINYTDLILPSGPIETPPAVIINPKTDPAFIFLSSGTTGKPKGVMLSHGALAMQMQIGFDAKIVESPSNGDHVPMNPPYHNFGLIVTAHVIRSGGTLLVINDYYNPDAYLMALEKYKVSHLYITPATLDLITVDPRGDKYDLNSLRSVCVVAAPPRKSLLEAVRAKFPKLRYWPSYGMTEAGGKCTIMPKWKDKEGSCGMLAPNILCKVINLETGKECGVNQPGEILFKSPSVMLGFYKNPEATKENFDEDGYLHTGDIGYYDEEGFFFWVDRLKDMIKLGGYSIAPAEIEAILLSHADVADAAVIGTPHPVLGEMPKAFVVKTPSAQVTEEELIKFVDDRTVSWNGLKGGVEFIDSIPKNPMGKILRRTLKEREKNKMK